MRPDYHMNTILCTFFFTIHIVFFKNIYWNRTFRFNNEIFRELFTIQVNHIIYVLFCMLSSSNICCITEIEINGHWTRIVKLFLRYIFWISFLKDMFTIFCYKLDLFVFWNIINATFYRQTLVCNAGMSKGLSFAAK